MSCRIAIDNTLNPSKLLFTNEELVTLIEFAVKNKLVKIELLDFQSRSKIVKVTKDKNGLRLTFSDEANSQMLITSMEEKKEPIVIDDLKDLL